MFDNLKNMMGGGASLAMLKPMLPKLIKEVVPKIQEAYIQKVQELEIEHDVTNVELIRGDEIEVVPFITMRDNQLKAQWVILRHTDDIILVEEVLESYTMEELLSMAQNDMAEIPKKEPQKLIKSARHDRFFLEKFVVVKENDKMVVISAPATEGQQVFYGHPDESICENWAEEANRNKL